MIVFKFSNKKKRSGNALSSKASYAIEDKTDHEIWEIMLCKGDVRFAAFPYNVLSVSLRERILHEDVLHIKQQICKIFSQKDLTFLEKAKLDYFLF